MNDNSSSTYIIVTKENIMNCEVIPYCETWAQALKDMKARLMGLPSILRAVNSLHATRMRLCSLTHPLKWEVSLAAGAED